MPNSFKRNITADALRFKGKITPQKLTALDFLKLTLLWPGFQLALLVRLQEVSRKIPKIGKILNRILTLVMYFGYKCDIDPGATFGPGVYFPHPIGIVIGSGCTFGKNASISQNVTVGRATHDAAADPQVKNDVSIFSGAVVLGEITLGDSSIVGANAVVTKNVPDYAIVAGVPAKVIKFTKKN